MLADVGLVVGVSWVQPARLSARPILAGADPCPPTGCILVYDRCYEARLVTDQLKASLSRSGSTWRCGPVRSKREIGVYSSLRARGGWPPVRPGEEQVVQLLERGDALMGRLGQERLSYVAVEPFLLAATLWLTGQSVDFGERFRRAVGEDRSRGLP